MLILITTRRGTSAAHVLAVRRQQEPTIILGMSAAWVQYGMGLWMDSNAARAQ